jgi:hypothetical protein
MTAAGTNAFFQAGADSDQLTYGQINEAARSALEAGGLGAMIRNATEKLDTGIIKGLEVANGMATNPHLALTFDGVDLKNHSFEWTLAPRDPSESESLARISKKIKQSILPTYATGTGRSYLKYPNAVDIFFLGTEARHLYYFKRAMVSSFTSDYAGAGSPAFLEGGAPAVVKMSMEVTEMDIHIADDYA